MEVGGAVAAAAQGQPGRRGGSAFLVQEPLVVGCFGDVGGQVLQHPVTQDRQLTRTQVCGLGEEVGLGLGDEVVAQVLGQVGEGLVDHAHLREVDLTRGERRLHVGPASLQRHRELRVGPDCAVGVAGLGRQPGRGGAVTGRLGNVVTNSQHAHLDRLQPGSGTGRLDQQLLLLARGQVDRVDGAQLVDHRVQPPDGEPRGGGHGTSQPSTTDRGPGSEPLIHKGFRGMLRGFEARRWRSSHLNRRSVVAGFRDADGPQPANKVVRERRPTSRARGTRPGRGRRRRTRRG